MAVTPLAPGSKGSRHLLSVSDHPRSLTHRPNPLNVLCRHSITAHIEKTLVHTLGPEQPLQTVNLPGAGRRWMLEDKHPASTLLYFAQLHSEFHHCQRLCPFLRASLGKKTVRIQILQRTKKCARRTHDQQSWPITMDHAPSPIAIHLVEAIPSPARRRAFR